MRRREFVWALGGVAAWPLAAKAQQPKIRAIGFLRPTAAAGFEHLVAALRQGLRESGYPDENNPAFELRWGEGHDDRMPKLAAELVELQVAAIVADLTAAVAAKAATTTIPIVFVSGADPLARGLVSSVNRPGGNVTGVSFFDIPVAAKRLEQLHVLVPKADVIAVLEDPNFSELQSETREVQAAAHNMRQKIVLVKAGREEEFEAAFAAIAQSGAGAVLVGAGPFINSRRHQVIELAALHAIPASYSLPEYVADGGLISYGASQTDAYRRAGIYVARILKGQKPGDLPVDLPTKFELAINLKTARSLGISVPPNLLAIADKVIE
jgi:putative tryptophan/tyrosine transport system substrate-binding protein